MITTKIYLDKRSPSLNGECPLKLTLTLKGKSAHLPLGIKLLPTQWDSTKGKVIDHPKKSILTNHVLKKKIEIDELIIKLTEQGKLAGRSITSVKNLIESVINDEDIEAHTFYKYFLTFAKSRRAERTREIYAETAKKLKEFKRGISKLQFEDITVDWLISFEKYLEKTEKSTNSRNIHLRNIRAAFNSAVDEELTKCYPFRKFKIKPSKTKKRSLKVEMLRTLFNAKCETEVEEWTLDFFKLSFFLIGINTVDLCRLTEINEGRIEFERAKTSRGYSILVPPEAIEIINRHRGSHYLIDALDRYKSVRVLTSSLGKNIKKITDRIKGMPKISMYWMRHTWATIASELDIPKETIAAGLGHGAETTTDIYINFNIKKVDQANRLIIDYVLK